MPNETAVRAELLDWLAANWDPDLSLLEWRRRLAGSGWATPTWPARWGGRGLPATEAAVVTKALADFGAVGPPEGVEVRPLRQANGHSSFNEVFLTDARIPAGDVVGEIGGGWTVALATLAHERRTPIASTIAAGHTGRAWREALEEAAHLRAPYKWYPQRAGRADLLVPHALTAGRGDEPLVRQEVARAITLAWVTRW